MIDREDEVILANLDVEEATERCFYFSTKACFWDRLAKANPGGAAWAEREARKCRDQEGHWFDMLNYAREHLRCLTKP